MDYDLILADPAWHFQNWNGAPEAICLAWLDYMDGKDVQSL